MMPIPEKPQVVTANDLITGEVIYRTEGAWVTRLVDAHVFHDPEAAERALVEAQAEEGKAVGVYLMEVSEGEDGPQALHFREAFRANGPSNYAHGKQTESNAA